MFQRLALCSAMVMFALSQDRLNMDLDRNSLELMLNLLDTDTQNGSLNPNNNDAMMIDHNTKIISLCKELQKKGHAKHLNLDKINVSFSSTTSDCFCFFLIFVNFY